MILSLKNFSINAVTFREEEITTNRFSAVINNIVWVAENVFKNRLLMTDVLQLKDNISTLATLSVDTVEIKIISTSESLDANHYPIIKVAAHSCGTATITTTAIDQHYTHLLTYTLSEYNTSLESTVFVNGPVTIEKNDEIFNIEWIKIKLSDESIITIDYNSLFDATNGNLTNIERTYIPISNYDPSKNSITNTYNEKLTEKEYGSYSLTFDANLFINGHRNPSLEYLVNDRMLRLNRGQEIIDFYITGKTPSFSSENIKYSITAQDAFSWLLSKQKINFDFSTEDETLWGSNNTGPKTIYELSSKILQYSKLTDSWIVDPDLQSNVMEFPTNLYDTTGQLRVSVDLSGTNPYNALVEVAKLFNAQILINYDTNPRIISFKNKEKFSYHGVKLHPEVNLSAFSYSEKADNLYSVMHVTGGEDAYGNYITMLPELPSIVSEFLIMFSKDNVYTTAPSWTLDKYEEAPYYYIVKSSGTNPYTVWKKQSRPSDGTTVLYGNVGNITGTPPKYNSINIFWEDIVNSDNNLGTVQIYQMFGYWLDQIASLLGTNYTIYKTSLHNYFKNLKYLQHASSTFYDFSYWYQNGLLPQSRYDTLMAFINNDLRNINLLLNSYTTIYNSFNYRLNQMIDKEQEYMSLMAAEDQLKATYNEENDDDTDGYLSLRGIYSSNDKTITSTSADGTSSYVSRYLMIGYALEGVVYYEVKDIDTTSTERPNSYITHYLPDFATIKSLMEDGCKVYSVSGDIPTSYSATDYDLVNDTFKLSGSSYTGPIYLKYYEDAHDSNEQINLAPNLADSSDDLLNVDKLYDQKIADYMQNISALWNNVYKKYYQSIYGSNWINDKLNDIKVKQNEKLALKNSLENQLIAGFGNNWRSIDINALSDPKFIEYSDLTQQLDDVGIYVGGTGTRQHSDGSYYTYKGQYDYYIACLQAYLSTSTTTDSKKPLKETVDDLRARKSEWEILFYKNYSDVIRETTYSDENQLTANGLYASAWKQLQQYKKPTTSYSASYIGVDSLEGVGEQIEIGEEIHLQYDRLKETIKSNAFKVTFNRLQNNLSDCFIKYIDCSVDGSTDENAPIKTSWCSIIARDHNTITLLDTSANSFDINTCIIQEININGTVYNYTNVHKIICVEKIYNSDVVKLKVNSITKDLRSPVCQLTVEENTLYNTLVDRLLYLLKNS